MENSCIFHNVPSCMLDGVACTAHCTALLCSTHLSHSITAHCTCTLAPCTLCTLQCPPRSHRSLSRSWLKGHGSRWHVWCTRGIFHWIWHGWKTWRLSQATSASHHSTHTLALWRWIVSSVVTAATTHAWPAIRQGSPLTQHTSPSAVTHLTHSCPNLIFCSGLLSNLTWSKVCSHE